MNFDDVLAQSKKPGSAQDHAILFLTGSVESDSDESMFRLYPRPEDRRCYYLLKRTDIAGELHELSNDEKGRAGYVGAKVYRAPLRFGSEAQLVVVKIHRLGESIVAGELPKPTKAASVGDCYATSGCSTGCCSIKSDGQCYCDTCCIA